MAERLLGMETEYGVSVLLKRSTASYPNDRAAEEIFNLARSTPHLPAHHSTGVFLANGSRFYVDCGHPEIATAECGNPWDVCRYLQAGERMLVELAGKFTRRDGGIAETLILKSNVDYTARTSWACHESYLHRCHDRGTLARQIIPHLVSRIVFTGGGGFDCFSPGLDFMLSPRVAHLHTAISGDSTGGGRGIFHTKDEPLSSNGYHRLHILSGESLSSETGAWLKVATTALVTALIEAGRRPGEKIELRDPVAAMRAFATDPSCSRFVRLADGREATALEIQYELLGHAEAHAEAAWMPPWAGKVCRQWRATLDRLQHGSAAVARTLDWAIKYALFQNRARRHNTTLEALAKWTPILTKLSAKLEGAAGAEQPVTVELILGRKSPLGEARQIVAPLLEEHDLDWDGLADFIQLRLELLEIDTRYSLLGQGGLFTALDSAGVLEHHFPGVDNIPHALENPPAGGRASIRGQIIRRLAGQNRRYAADWDGVWDLEVGDELNLSDPFCTKEKWKKPKRRIDAHRFPENLSARIGANRTLENSIPVDLFWAGRYVEMLDQIDGTEDSSAEDESIVLAYARIGRRAEAVALLDSLPDHFECHPLALKLSILSNGLVPAVEEMAPLVTMGDRRMEEEPENWNAYSRFVFLSYKALFLLHKGLYQLAEPLFLALLADQSNAMRSRLCSRNRCFLAELYRRLGRRSEAMELVQAAQLTHHTENLPGDLATYSLPMLAKLIGNTGQAASLLDCAEATHRMDRNNLGLARVLCLRARRVRTSQDREQIETLLRGVPVLANCAVARRITREFDSWVTPSGDGPVDYWGL